MSILAELIGQVLDEKYRIEKQLGQGGMGAVFLATHLGTGRPVALKVISPQFMANEEFVERFKREAKAAGLLRHPNVVNVTDFGFAKIASGRVAYLVMEYLNGSNLGELLNKRGKLPLAFVVDIVEQICLAIGAAHKQNIIHRDLKPDNIWLEPNGRGGYNVKVLDFGLAKLRQSNAPVETRLPLPKPADLARMANIDMEGETQVQNGAATDPDAQATAVQTPYGSQQNQNITPMIKADRTVGNQNVTVAAGNLTQAGAILGTPIYMSPEQCMGLDLDARSDIYSLGVIIYQTLAGETPFQGTTQTLMVQHMTALPPALMEKQKDIPAPIAALVMTALAKEPADRPATAEIFSTALRASSESEVHIMRESRYYTTTLVGKLFFLSALIYIPFIILIGLLTNLIKSIGLSSSALTLAIIVAIYFFFIFTANQIHTAACAIAVNMLGFKPAGTLPIIAILKELKKRLGVILLAAIRGHFTVIIGLFKLIAPGYQAFINNALVAPVAALEKDNVGQTFERSKKLTDYLRPVAMAMQLRELGATLISALMFPAGLALGAASNSQSMNATDLLSILNVGTLLYSHFFLISIHSIYPAIPLAFLYFKTRQANGEKLDEHIIQNNDSENSDVIKSGLPKGALVWIVIPALILLFIISTTFIFNPRSLASAANKGKNKLVQDLIKKGAKVNEKDGDGTTPLMLAAQEGHSNVLRSLLAAGADINLKDHDGDTAIFYAAIGGSVDVIKALLAAGGNVKAVNKYGENPLVYAVQKGHIGAARLLIEAGADVKMRDRKGKTLLQLAEQENDAEMKDLLKAVGAKE